MIEQRVFKQFFRLRQTSRSHPHRDVGAAFIVICVAGREHNRVPQRHAKMATRVIDIRLTINIQFQLPMFTHDKEQLIEIRRVIINRFKHIARDERFIIAA